MKLLPLIVQDENASGAATGGHAAARGASRWLRPLLAVAGVLEIGLFGCGLVFFGRYIEPFVREWDPHIYKEYGVARIALGAAFLFGARSGGGAALLAGTLAALFFAFNTCVSLFDLAAGNVAAIEWAVVAYSALLVFALAAALRRAP